MSFVLQIIVAGVVMLSSVLFAHYVKNNTR